MRNVSLVVEYDGTDYEGWQAQGRPGAYLSTSKRARFPTIQETIENSILSLTGQKPNLIASGRTDAGVHALGQVAAFRTSSRLDTPTIKRALNATLPSDIRIVSADSAPASFHPRRSATSRRYVYLMGLAHDLPVFIRRFVWAVPYKLDIGLISEALSHFVGTHDFSAFRGAGCGAKSTVREITSAVIEPANGMDFLAWRLEGDYLKLTVEANAFLRHMVRNIAGTLVEAGRGKIRPDAIHEIIASGNRSLAGPTAPARGLFLEKVVYTDRQKI